MKLINSILCILLPLISGPFCVSSSKSNNFLNLVNDAKLVQNELQKYEDKYLLYPWDDISSKTCFAINEVSRYVEGLKKQNRVTSYDVNESSITFTHKCGLTFAFAPKQAGTYSGDLKYVQNKIDLYTFQPTYSESEAIEDDKMSLPDGIENDAKLIEAAANFISSSFENVTYDEYHTSKNTPILHHDIEGLGPNQIILMQGHGVWLEGHHSTINTGKDFDWESYVYDEQYREDCDEKRIIADGYSEVLTYRFIEKYVDDLTNSVIYLGQCQSMFDNTLAQSFINKGAAAVFGNTETVIMRYGDVMQYTVAKLLASKKPGSEQYYSCEEALAKAKEMYGEDDSVLHPGMGAHCEVKLLGKKDYRLNEPVECPVFRKEIVYNTCEQTCIYPGLGFTANGSSATDAGHYEVTLTLNDGYKWRDETTEEIIYGWDISKRITKLDDIVAPVGFNNLVYNGQNQPLMTQGSAGFGKFYYCLEGEEYQNSVPFGKEIGTYHVCWFFEGDGNHTDIGSFHNPIKENIPIMKGEGVPTRIPSYLVALIIFGSLFAVAAIILIIVNVAAKKKH